MKRLALALAALLAAGIAYAESAFTNKATELLAQAQSDSATVAPLAENTKVEVLARKGAWAQVKTANGQTGWVRMMALKLEGSGGSGTAQNAAPVSANPVGALGNLLSAGRTSNTATVTTGVRGLSEEDLQNAQANPAELEKMQKFSVKKDEAQAFAQRANLAPAQVEYLPEPTPVQTNNRNVDGS